MYSFFAFLYRMKYITRWGLMNNIRPENSAEHCQHTAIIAHALAVIDNRIFNKNIDANKVGMLAVYHDTSEVFTGDMPTPVKYFSKEIRNAYAGVESYAEEKLMGFLPNELKDDLKALVAPDKESYEHKLVKCADKLSAYVKCIEELKSRNQEFKSALKSIESALKEISNQMPCVKYFIENFIDAYYKNLDELT